MASAKKFQPAARGMPGVRLRAAKKTIQPAKFSASCRMRTAGMEPAGDRQHAGEQPAVKRGMVIGAGREKFAIQNFERPVVILLHVRAIAASNSGDARNCHR